MEFSHLLIVIAYSHSCRDSEKRVAMSQSTPRAWPNVFFVFVVVFFADHRLMRWTLFFCTLRKNCRVVVVMLMCLLESIILLERFIKCLSSIFTKNNNILPVAGVTYFQHRALSDVACWTFSNFSRCSYFLFRWCSSSSTVCTANFHKQSQFIAAGNNGEGERINNWFDLKWKFMQNSISALTACCHRHHLPPLEVLLSIDTRSTTTYQVNVNVKQIFSLIERVEYINLSANP